ncbi:MAG: TIR domain-containing protein, partial [Pseudomonadota bacterium]
KAEPVARAEPKAPPPAPRAKTRSEREREEEDRIARELAQKKSVQVAAVSPSASAPAAAAAGMPPEDLFRQAREMETSDPKGAVKIYRSLARKGNGKAALRLGEIYDRGITGVPRDYQESLSWYQKARDLGEAVETARGRGFGGWSSAAPAPVEAPKTETPRPAAMPAEAPKTEASKPAAKSAPVAAVPTAPAAPPAPLAEEKPRAIYIVVALVAALLAVGVWLWRRRRRVRSKAAQPAQPPAAPPAADGAMLFVSYSHKDKTRIEPIVSMIEESGRQVWMDRTGITGQAGWAGQIVRAIRQSRAVVLMASPNSYASDQVVRELYLAMNHKKPIVPIEIEPAELPDELQYILAPFQHHRLSGREPREVLGRALAAV